MKAIRIHENGDENVLKYEDIEEPVCGSNQVKVKICSSSINHLDLWIRMGIPSLKTTFPMILGSDAAGKITEIGEQIKDYKVGDDILVQPGVFCNECKLCNQGKENYCSKYGIIGENYNGIQAEYVILNPANIYLKPSCLDYNEAASMPLTFMTAYEMLVKRAKLQKNETVLIYGGSSGVGSAAIQICKDIGANIITTAGNSIKSKFCLDLGANYVLDHNSNKMYEKIKQITGKSGVNVVFEHIGYKTWNYSLHLLSRGGRIVTCGATTGNKVEINLSHLFIKQQSILGSTMSSLLTFKEIIKKINDKVYKPVIGKVFNFADIRDAHKYMNDRKQIGKIVLSFNK
tara:strand:+ start:518 stop:1552 length:1035 start_codon:yes stop_codon:yes gene_type:complete